MIRGCSLYQPDKYSPARLPTFFSRADCTNRLPWSPSPSSSLSLGPSPSPPSPALLRRRCSPDLVDGNGRPDFDPLAAEAPTRGRGKSQASCSSVCCPSSYRFKRPVDISLTSWVSCRCDGCRRVKEKCEGGVPCRRCLRYRRQCNFTHIDPNEKSRSTSVS